LPIFGWWASPIILGGGGRPAPRPGVTAWGGEEPRARERVDAVSDSRFLGFEMSNVREKIVYITLLNDVF
jgi:hypothetical protein